MLVAVSTALLTAAALAFLIGVAHSLLGERYILVRLLRRENLPRLFGGDRFTKRTLRFAWHVTTVAWWGLGAVLVVVADGGSARRVLWAVAATFLVTGAIALVASRGRHLSWIVFLAIGALTLWGAGALAP